MLVNLAKSLCVSSVVAIGLMVSPLARADSGSHSTEHVDAASRTHGKQQREPAGESPHQGDPKAGLLWIGGAVVALVFLAWLAMRIGDVDQASDKVPN